MSKIIIPENLKGKELYKFLIANKDALVAQKKSGVKYSDPLDCLPGMMTIDKDGQLQIKAEGDDTALPADTEDSLMRRVVANAMNWCDHAMDVLFDDCAKKTIKERKGLIPHIADHIHRSDSHVGDVKDITLEQIELKRLGLKAEGSTQCIVFTTEIRKDYNEKIFFFYKKNKIKQHSIGLQYVKILLCINDEEEKEYHDNWKKYIDRVINKEMVESRGYFWAVLEIRLLENSCVLFGCNELTPTLDVKIDTEETQPPTSTEKSQPSPTSEVTVDKSVAWDKIVGKINF